MSNTLKGMLALGLFALMLMTAGQTTPEQLKMPLFEKAQEAIGASR